MLYTIFFCIFIFSILSFRLTKWWVSNIVRVSYLRLQVQHRSRIMHNFVEELFSFVHIIVNQDYELMKVGFFVKCWQRLQVSFFFVAELTTEKKAVITTSASLPVPNWFLHEHYISYSKFWYTCTLLFLLKLSLDFTAWHFCWRMLSSS